MKLEIGSPELGIASNGKLHQLQTEFIAHQRGFFFQRIMRSHHEPHLVQPFVFTKIVGKRQMSDMYRIERTAENAYIHLIN